MSCVLSIKEIKYGRRSDLIYLLASCWFMRAFLFSLLFPFPLDAYSFFVFLMSVLCFGYLRILVG